MVKILPVVVVFYLNMYCKIAIFAESAKTVFIQLNGQYPPKVASYTSFKSEIEFPLPSPLSGNQNAILNGKFTQRHNKNLKRIYNYTCFKSIYASLYAKTPFLPLSLHFFSNF